MQGFSSVDGVNTAQAGSRKGICSRHVRPFVKKCSAHADIRYEGTCMRSLRVPLVTSSDAREALVVHNFFFALRRM